MTTLTFSDIITNGYTYPSAVSEDLQAVIYDWYKNRYVCDDDNFSDYFTRLLNRDMARYNQLLRIEPGYAEYDWAVTSYRERQVKESGSGETSQSTNMTKTSTPDRTETTKHTGTNAVAQAYDSNYKHTGTATDKTAYGQSLSHTGNDKIDNTGTVTDSGSRTVSDDTTVTTTGDSRTMSRTAPMSAEYSSTGNSGRDSSLPSGLSWSTASSQAETDSKQSQTTDDDISETTGNTRTDNTSQTTTYDSRDTKGGADTLTKTNDLTDAHTGTDTETSTYNDSIVKTITGGDTDAETGTITGTSANENLTREIFTGRDGQLARIMDFAKGFIIGTNAWEWLASEIDTVFMGVYDV